MPTIERRPLPPPNSAVTKITEADRAEIVARANDVIDHYLNGPGSYFDSGTRKPLTGEPGDDSTIQDLNNFKGSVIASMQFADDPNSIMRSVVDLIDRAKEEVEKTAQNNEGRDNIALPFPDIVDPIDDPRVTSPRALSNSALPISVPMEGSRWVSPPDASLTLGVSSDHPVRTLSRKVVAAPQGPNSQESSSDRFGSWTSSPPLNGPCGLYQPAPPQTSRSIGIVSGEPMPDWPVRPPIWDFSDKSAASGEDSDAWLGRLLRTVGTY